MIRPRKSVAESEIYKAPLEGRSRYVRLDFNENTAATESLNQYPEYSVLQNMLAESLGIKAEQLVLTNGSSEAIFLAVFSFIEPGFDKALTSLPTFGLIPHYLQLCGADVIQIPVTDALEFDIASIESALGQGVKLAIFASPDNPTGAVLCSDTLMRWLELFPETLFVIDEAYGEFNSDRLDLTLAARLRNLLVLRTFSKAMGMAGSRLGFIAGSEELINILTRVKAPYSVNAHAVDAGIIALSKRRSDDNAIARMLNRKKQVITFLNESGFDCHSGGANFFLIKMGIDAGNFCKFTRANGVLVRDRSFMPKLDGMVRVSIGTQEEMTTFIKVVDRYREKSALIFDLDDTLVDASKSYPEAVKKAVVQFGGKPSTDEEYWQLKAEGGFNDDWVTALELLARQNICVSLESVIKIGKAEYLKTAKALERLLFLPSTLAKLRKRYRLFIFTGRYRDEYEPIWGKKLTPEFEKVFCVDDFGPLRPKPAPDMLQKILQENDLQNSWYVGNSIDDVRAARAASMGTIAITTTLSRKQFEAEGADVVIDSPDQLPGVFGL